MRISLSAPNTHRTRGRMQTIGKNDFLFLTLERRRQCEDQLQNLWSPVHNENVESLVQKLSMILRRLQQSVKQRRGFSVCRTLCSCPGHVPSEPALAVWCRVVILKYVGDPHFGPCTLLNSLKIRDCPHQNHQYSYFLRSLLPSQLPAFWNCWSFKIPTKTHGYHFIRRDQIELKTKQKEWTP